MQLLKQIRLATYFAIFILITSCSSTRFVPQNEYLLEDVQIKSDQKGFDAASLEPYIRQKANSKWFSLFKIPMGTYALSGRDTTKWVNRTLQKIGEKPVIFDTLQARLSQKDLKTALQNAGYMHAEVSFDVKTKGKSLTAIYTLHPGKPYYINSVTYDIQDQQIQRMLALDRPENAALGLKAGSRFTVDRLDEERERITKLLLDSGFYKFHKDFIVFEADSTRQRTGVNLIVKLLKYRANSDAPITNHPRYTIRTIRYTSKDSTKINLRPSVLMYNTALIEEELFSASKLQQTYLNFAKLQAIQYTNIRFRELPDTTLLDCDIQLSQQKPRTISFQPEGTNTAGDLGAAVLFTYENRNLFRGSEVLSLQLRGAFEAITGLEGYNDQDYQEYNAEAKILFPRFLAPFLSHSFRRQRSASSEISLSYNLQNRPEFHRRVFSSAFRYRWSEPHHHLSYRLDLIDLNYVHMPWISDTFKRDYLDSVNNRNAILRYNYENLLLMKIGFGVTYNDGQHAVIANIETVGNILGGVAKPLGFKKNEEGQYKLFNTAFAQFVKGDIAYTRLIAFDPNNSLALHVGLGIAYPYGNSKVLPFEKRYFSGGANSVRGWSVRELGPGSFRGTDGRIDFINQTGDMKLDMNAEFRTKLFWKLNGAAFIDAGNIWTLRAYEEQPGGQFKLDQFYKQIAVAYGLGLRLNFGYFILRFDMGMKAINPAYTSNEEHYALLHPNLKRDFAFHFAVGLPF